MPLPLLWLVGAAAASVAGYAAKKMMEDDDSSGGRDDYSSYEEERRRQEKAEKKTRKAEEKRKKELLETEFANTGEKYRHDISCALNNIVSLNFEKTSGFCRTLVGESQAGSEQQISWANNYCTTEIKQNLSFLAESYAVEILPAAQFKKHREAIDDSMSSIEELMHVKQALAMRKRQLKKVAN